LAIGCSLIGYAVAVAPTTLGPRGPAFLALCVAPLVTGLGLYLRAYWLDS
jgi:hypothetical protein